MGNGPARREFGVSAADAEELVTTMGQISDARYTVNYMEDGECGRQFPRALYECHPGPVKWRRQNPGRGDAGRISADECARATEALLKCMKRRPGHFSAYIRRIEDPDHRPETKGPPEPWEDGDSLFSERKFRWWEGMRRS